MAQLKTQKGAALRCIDEGMDIENLWSEIARDVPPPEPETASSSSGCHDEGKDAFEDVWSELIRVFSPPQPETACSSSGCYDEGMDAFEDVWSELIRNFSPPQPETACSSSGCYDEGIDLENLWSELARDVPPLQPETGSSSSGCHDEGMDAFEDVWSELIRDISPPQPETACSSSGCHDEGIDLENLWSELARDVPPLQPETGSSSSGCHDESIETLEECYGQLDEMRAPGIDPAPPMRHVQAVDTSLMDPRDQERLGILRHHGVEFLHDAANLNNGMFTVEPLGTLGDCSPIMSLKLNNYAHRQAVDKFTEGSGLVVKVVSQDVPWSEKKAMERELSVVKNLMPGCHSHVIDYVSLSVDKFAIIMKAEWCDLEHLLEIKSPLEAMGRGQRLRLFSGAVQGLVYLHSCGYTHMDIKPSNLMVDKAITRLKVADLGYAGRSYEELFTGGTTEYLAPEVLGLYKDPDILEAVVDPTMDAWAVGVMLLQVLFVQELPRTDIDELAIHGLMPKQKPFLASLCYAEIFGDKAELTGLPDDQILAFEAQKAYHALMTKYGMQQVKMEEDLTAGLLCRGKWDEPGGLRFHEEVTKVLLSLLDRNPLQRLPLPELIRLLECDALWAAASDNVAVLPASLQEILVGLDRPRTASRGVWWTSNPWWMNPPSYGAPIPDGPFNQEPQDEVMLQPEQAAWLASLGFFVTIPTGSTGYDAAES